MSGVGTKKRVRVVADVLACRKRARRGLQQVAAAARGRADLPRRLGVPADAARHGGMIPSAVAKVPLVRPRSERGVLELDLEFELSPRAEHRRAAGVARSPDDRQPLALLVGAVPSRQEIRWRGRRRTVGDDRDVFVGKWSVDQRVFPRVVSSDPVAEEGRELADLERDARILEEERVAEAIFVEPHGCGVLARVEAAIGAQLDEGREVVPEPTVEKEPQARVGEVVVAAEDEPRRLLVEPVSFDVEESGDLKLREPAGAGPAQSLAELVEDLRLGARRRGGEG